jgi:MobA/VirD2-like, nuclease domain
MILKASERGGAAQLGMHLLKTEENEHVEVHEVRGFVSDDVVGAMREVNAIAKGTRCSQFLFSVSLNPPPQESVHTDTFEGAIDQIEDRNNLTGQPRIIVFHEKEGRRHAHAVWSRIDAETMTARNLPHYKMKLQDISRGLYRDNGWDMPDGLRDKKLRDPRNFTLAEWQQAKRMGVNAKDLKTAMQEAWNTSDSKKAFARALEDRGMFLAKGDRRVHVAVTYEGEALSIARYTGKKAKEVRERLGKPDALRSVTETQAHIADFMTPTVKKHLHDHRFKMHKEMADLMIRRETIAEANRYERAKLEQAQQTRWTTETKARSDRIQKGVRGLWQKVTGKHAQIQKQNEMETFFAHERDKKQSHDLRTAQMTERRGLQTEIQAVRQSHTKGQTQLYKDLGSYHRMQERASIRHEFNRNSAQKVRSPATRNIPTMER